VGELTPVASDDAAGHHREAKRFAARRSCGLVEDVLALARLVQRGRNGVVLVGVRNGRPDGAWLRPAADDDRRPGLLQRLGLELGCGRPVADERRELPVELVEPLAKRREGETVGLVLGLEPARAEPQLDAATRAGVAG